MKRYIGLVSCVLLLLTGCGDKESSISQSEVKENILSESVESTTKEKTEVIEDFTTPQPQVTLYNGMSFELLKSSDLNKFQLNSESHFDTNISTNQSIALYNENIYYVSDDFHLMKLDTKTNTETLVSRATVVSFYHYENQLFFYGEDESGEYCVFSFDLDNDTVTKRDDLFYYSNEVFNNAVGIICNNIGIDFSFLHLVSEVNYAMFLGNNSEDICSVIDDKFIVFVEGNYLSGVNCTKYDDKCDIAIGIDINTGEISYLFDSERWYDLQYDEVSNRYIMFSEYMDGNTNLYRYDFSSNQTEFITDMSDKRLKNYFFIEENIFCYSNDEFLYKLDENNQIVDMEYPVPSFMQQNGESFCYFNYDETEVYQILKNGEILKYDIPYNFEDEYMYTFGMYGDAIYGTFGGKKIFEYKNNALKTYSFEGKILAVDENYIYCSGIPYTECTPTESIAFINQYGEYHSENHKQGAGEIARLYTAEDIKKQEQIYKIRKDNQLVSSNPITEQETTQMESDDISGILTSPETYGVSWNFSISTVKQCMSEYTLVIDEMLMGDIPGMPVETYLGYTVPMNGTSYTVTFVFKDDELNHINYSD